MATRLKTGGRSAGTPNKATIEIKEAARMHAAAALAELARIMTSSDSDPARIAACREILDRAYGKSLQSMTCEGGGPPHLDEHWIAPARKPFEAFLRDALGASRTRAVQDATEPAAE